MFKCSMASKILKAKFHYAIQLANQLANCDMLASC